MAVLETSMTSQTRENTKKTLKNAKKEEKKVLVVAQELKLARVLAGNNKTARDRALKSLKKWFRNRSTTIPFTEDDFLRLWKGLFYSMWMSDKPLIQEECAENIATLVHSLPLETSILFYKCGMTILMNEWFGIDQLRLDKFSMFVRRLLRQILFVLKNETWSSNAVHKFTDCLSETILNTDKQKPMGLLMHFIEIYLEELAKVSEGELPHQRTTDFLIPFIKELAFSDDPRIIDHIRKHIFVYLIRQSDLGLEYDDKYKAWRSMGFPGSIDSVVKVEVSDDEFEEDEINGEEREFDPRAGRVDVGLPQLKFSAKTVAKVLSEHKFLKKTNSKSRKCLNDYVEHFRKLASGVYPLGVKKVKLAEDDYDMTIKKAVNRLVKFDQKIKGKNRKRKNDDREIELRGGKKIKLDKDFCNTIQNDLNNKIKKKKRKNENNIDEFSPVEQKKTKPMLEIESIFRRNSGTWLVTKTVPQKPEEGAESNKEKEKSIFLNTQWDDEDPIKKKKTLIKNPFANSTPVKKVKINTKLNRSQEVQEHVAQILSSPAIPFDANKKPLKPLLKTPTVKSPINPFYAL